MRSHGQGGRTHDQGCGRDLSGFMGVTPPCFTIPNHHASRSQTTMLHDPKCRFDYPLAPIRLHHAGLFSLDCPSRTPPINTKLMTTFKGSRTQNRRIILPSSTQTSSPSRRTVDRAGTPAHNCTAPKRRTSRVDAHPLGSEHQAVRFAIVNTFGTPGGTCCQKFMVETRAQAKLKNKTVEMSFEAPESTSLITITETEHAVRISASGLITTDRAAESMGGQAVMEDLMAKQAYKIETSFMAAMDKFSSKLRMFFQERMPVTSSATPPRAG
ncbi:unnamed protein product [Prunus armeniaca]